MTLRDAFKVIAFYKIFLLKHMVHISHSRQLAQRDPFLTGPVIRNEKKQSKKSLLSIKMWMQPARNEPAPLEWNQ